MDNYIVTKESLTSIADKIRTKANITDTLIYPTDFISTIEEIPSYEKIYSGTVTASTTSTTFINVATLQLGTEAWRRDRILYIKIRDTAGRRNSYFYGSDSWYPNFNAGQGSTSTVSNCPCIYYRTSSTGAVLSTSASAVSSYGVMPYQLTSAGELSIRARYSSSNSLTINGTFSVEVYLIRWPDSDSIPWQPSA